MTQVFISYSRRDLAFVEQLAADLKSDGLDVWYDLSGLEGGARWRIEIEKAVRVSQYILVILSPDSVDSEWVEREYLFANNLKKEIVPLFYKPCDLPLYYLNVHYIDVQGENYKRNYKEILRALDVKPVAQKPSIPEREVPASEKPDDKVDEGLQPEPVEVEHRDWRKLKPYGLIVLIGVVVLFLAFGLPKLFQNPPAVASDTPTHTQKPATLTSIPVSLSKTLQPSMTPTETLIPTLTPIPSPYPEEIVDGQKVEMILVPAGIFAMGSNIFNEEVPVHRVYLDDYYIDKFEVTNALYRTCEQAGVCDPPRATFSTLHADYYSAPDFSEFPVIFVDWDMAVTYCEKWRGAHLPTEAQWEKAARGTNERKYPWGNDADCFHTNYWVSSSTACVGDTTRVGSYSAGASPYGVHDMAGNVWEWVNDSYDPFYYGSLTDGFRNPTGPVRNINSIVIRGGGWDSGINGVRAAYRGFQPHTYYANNLGFRCALDVNQVDVSTLAADILTNQDWQEYVVGNQGSTIEVQSAANNSVRINFNLLEGDWAAVYQKLSPDFLTGTNGLRITYKGHGAPNTIDVKLFHKDETLCHHYIDSKTDTSEVTETFEIPYSEFECESTILDLENLDRLDFSFSNWPSHGDEPGEGELVVEVIQLVH